MIEIKQRNAFTMIELLFVIVIMGIVGGIALETIRQYYENIYRTQEYTKRVSEADHILDQVAKYFENAISSSIVNLDRGTTTDCYGPPIDGDTNDYTVAFIAADQDSLRGISGVRPGWNEDTLLLPGNELNASDGNLTMADDIIMDLYPNSSLVQSAIYDSDSADVGACFRFRWKGTGTAGYHTLASGFTEKQYHLDTDNNATHGKRKYLLRTGYAFRVQNNGDFTMYSNFRPWRGERHNDGNTNRKVNLLAQNVAHFYADYNATDFQNDTNVTDRGLVWRLKVCMRGLDANLSDSNAETQTICRERRVHVRY